MEHLKFELNGSLHKDFNATEAYLASNQVMTLKWTEVVEAVCLLRHKAGLHPDKCLGYKISEGQIIFLFR